VNDRDNFSLRVERDPHEDPLGHTTYLRHQFVQLHMVAHQVPEIVLVQPLGVLCQTGQPALDGAFIVSEDTAAGRHIDPFAQRGGDFRHPCCARLQPIHRRIDAGADLAPTRLALEIRDHIRPMMLAVTHQRVQLTIRDPIISTRLVHAAVSLRLN
jgi:hypothetical protein